MLNDKDLASYISDLKELVAIDSPSDNFEGMQQIIDFCKKHVEPLNLICIEKKSDHLKAPCLLITNAENINQEKIDILMLAHMDTVYPVGTADNRGFNIVENKAFGAGVIDNKGGLLLGLYALRYIDLKNSRIAFFVNSNEEEGSEYNCEFIKEIAKNSNCCLCLEPAREDGSLVNSRFGRAVYDVNITKVGNSAKVIGQNFENPIVVLSSIISALSAYNDVNKNVVIDFKVVGQKGDGNYLGGQEIQLKIGARFANKELLDLVDAILNQLGIFESDVIKVESKQTSYYPPLEDNIGSKKIKFLVEYLGKANYIDITWQDSLGGSDGCFASSVGCPTIDGLGPIGGNFHDEKEYIDLSSVIPRGNLLISVMQYLVKIK